MSSKNVLPPTWPYPSDEPKEDEDVLDLFGFNEETQKSGWECVDIVVCKDGNCFWFNEQEQSDGRTFYDFLTEMGTTNLEDSEVEDIPTEPGVYRCFVYCRTFGPDHNGEYDCVTKIVNPVKLWGI